MQNAEWQSRIEPLGGKAAALPVQRFTSSPYRQWWLQMKASTLFRLLACVSFAGAAYFVLLAYEEDNRIWLVSVGACGLAGIIFLMRADCGGERKLW
jgi:hypothetical protein